MRRNWLTTIGLQVFKDQAVVQPTEYLRANLAIGLFLSIGLVAGTGHTQTLGLLPASVLALAAAALVGGYLLATLLPRMESTTVFVQALLLMFAVASLVGTSLWLICARTPLVNFRYLPGLALCLFVYASLQVEFMGPQSWRVLRPRRVGVALGLGSELAMAACLLWRLGQA